MIRVVMLSTILLLISTKAFSWVSINGDYISGKYASKSYTKLGSSKYVKRYSTKKRNKYDDSTMPTTDTAKKIINKLNINIEGTEWLKGKNSSTTNIYNKDITIYSSDNSKNTIDNSDNPYKTNSVTINNDSNSNLSSSKNTTSAKDFMNNISNPSTTNSKATTYNFTPIENASK
jgi:hypothetical protein